MNAILLKNETFGINTMLWNIYSKMGQIEVIHTQCFGI